jgi:hypothetical protein
LGHPPLCLMNSYTKKVVFISYLLKSTDSKKAHSAPFYRYSSLLNLISG